MKTHFRQDHGICEETGKKMFTHTDAEHVAVELRRAQHTNHAPYRCHHCGFAHVGSSAVRTRPPARPRRKPSGHWRRPANGPAGERSQSAARPAEPKRPTSGAARPAVPLPERGQNLA